MRCEIMRYTILKIAVALFVAATLWSCSLLKFSVSTGDPLPRSDVQVRVMTRGFYYDMVAQISRAADSIAVASPDVQTKVRTIRWKMQATRAAVSAAMQSIPDVALADTWILCRRMNDAFATTPDSLLFGAQSSLARGTARRLELKAAHLAREVLTKERFGLMERFVGEYIASNPPPKDGVEASNTTLAWLNFLKAHGVESLYATGSISEVIADMSDKVGGQTQQISNSLGWSKDIFELQMQQDSIRSQLTQQLDSLERNFKRMAVVMENIPGISDQVMSSFNAQMRSLMWSMNASVNNAFTNIDKQRDELQQFITSEREAVLREASKVADDAVRAALDGLPAMLAKIIVWVVLFLVVIIGAPFAAGLWVGKRRRDN